MAQWRAKDWGSTYRGLANGVLEGYWCRRELRHRKSSARAPRCFLLPRTEFLDFFSFKILFWFLTSEMSFRFMCFPKDLLKRKGWVDAQRSVKNVEMIIFFFSFSFSRLQAI
ncbi:hypothetical protein CEXT_815501 [Caerostris extrusa]|uniref:Uncharacterized protein n=1 Tax=Caerostris extrusa TaxID=172846 RepID=A0AAV4V334_CAEEX|nr:hypothetical protein CEXT_815501 [Caerostris extrusa]